MVCEVMAVTDMVYPLEVVWMTTTGPGTGRPPGEEDAPGLEVRTT
jgi:hypothetical protein